MNGAGTVGFLRRHAPVGKFTAYEKTKKLDLARLVDLKAPDPWGVAILWASHLMWVALISSIELPRRAPDCDREWPLLLWVRQILVRVS